MDHKNTGNALFAERKFAKAIRSYTAGIEMLERQAKGSALNADDRKGCSSCATRTGLLHTTR